MNFKELFPELTHTFGNMLGSLDGEMSYMKSSYNQRWYVWTPKIAINMMENVLSEAKVNNNGKIYYDKNYVVGAITLDEVDLGNGEHECKIGEGQQRITTHVLNKKALADDIVFLGFTDNASVKTRGKILDQISYTKDDETFCKLRLHNNLDNEDLQKIIAFDPSGSKMPNSIGAASEMIGVRKDSYLLKVYYSLLKAISKIVKKPYNGKNFDINDIFTALNKVSVSIHYQNCEDEFAQKFSSMNQDLVLMTKYNLLCNKFGKIIGSGKMANYCEKLANSVEFRRNCNKFIQIISIHDAKMKNATPKVDDIMSYYDACYERQSKGTSLEGNVGIYEGYAKKLFEVYGGVYVDMLELNSCTIPTDILLLLKEMQALSKNLWQVVAMGCVKLIINEGVNSLIELSNESLDVVRSMFQMFIVYSMMRNFKVVKEASATSTFANFFVNHEYTNSDIISSFKRFLSTDIAAKVAMPSAEDMLKSMISKSPDGPASKFILMNIEAYVNPYKITVQQLVDEGYENEHIAPLDDSKTKHYELTEEERESFANASLLQPDDNVLADNDKVEVKNENVYQYSKLCLNNVAIVGKKKMKSNRGALSANYYVHKGKKNTVLDRDYLETRGAALLEILLEIKEKTFE